MASASTRLMALIMVSAALASCSEPDKATETAAQMVGVEKASSTQYQPVAAITGEVEARIQTDLAFRVGGKVIARNVDVGNHVRKGDVLMRLDNTEQLADVAIAEASLRAAQADLKQKRLAFERYQALIASHAAAQQVLDQAQQDLATAQGSLESAEASLATARDSLSYTELRADSDGIITARNIEIGAVVTAAQSALTIAHDGPRDAVFDVYEAFFLEGEPSRQVEVSPINDPAQTVTARIRETSPVIDDKTGTIHIKLSLPQDADWVLGTPVLGHFQAPAKTGITLPWGAMSSASGVPAVWVVNPKSRTATLQPVKVALYRLGDFVVSDGLTTGDIVVTDGGKLLRPDAILDWKGR
ncbi:RND family efflux transporter MFP subunit [Agrobacterium vitis]|nr:RND family efflux transporter MFP subunit [Agrobacterium vitis]MBE1436394.1 RND family efflux transporter MFP subunit [Agrobacterium vitis]